MVLLKLGPLGRYDDKNHWEETGRGKISHIFITFCSSYVQSIQFGYVENGDLVMSKKYGSYEENQSTRILRLNHESEFVTGISGEKYYSTISSLTFHTNKRKHEAFHADFGSDIRRPERFEFLAEIQDHLEFGGFFGSYNYAGLSSIGLYLEPILVHSPNC
ncbi:Jacalin-like lectin domain superfamily [Arabidopsis suecica]|uniref:Jacalin-like lectin domain superfamily n=1 Tax=Arabidopsis suecica TaxID=45249 RepID=A0A8T2AKL7_ARASU|nr:Jacalin-like lectin domain superfamily [Arabidopsis suecica]